MNVVVHRATAPLDKEAFEELKRAYREENARYTKKMLFRVGNGAGLYSEIGSLLECMMYCRLHGIAFSLYSDGANFAGENGWSDYFVPFCEENHDKLNHYLNSRGFYGKDRWFRKFGAFLFKKKAHVDYLTQDCFQTLCTKEFKEIHFDWELFHIHGNLREEYAKLANLAFCFNEKTRKKIVGLIQGLHLPDRYVSVHVRSGDSYLAKRGKLQGVDATVEQMRNAGRDISSVFVFTDDYRNVERMRELCPEWKVYTLAGEEERGYYNAEFNRQSWEYRYENIVKLFAMIECCLNAETHFGYAGSCTNNYIYSVRACEKSDYILLENVDYQAMPEKQY